MTEDTQVPEQSPAGEAPAETETPGAPIDILTVVRTCVALLDNQAWQAMGLRPDPITRAVAKDLEQARLAIDCIAALLDRVSAHLAEPEARELATLLTNLRLNFVRQQ